MLFAYFIGSQFATTRSTSFISLDRKAGECDEVPISVTGSFNLDSNGFWSGDSQYNPNAAMYSFDAHNFQKDTKGYHSVIDQQRLSFANLGRVGKLHNIAYNLLYWVGWSEITTTGNSTQRWQLTGDAKVVLDRQYILGSLSNKKSDCSATATVVYSPGTGKYVMTYQSTNFKASPECGNVTQLIQPPYANLKGNTDVIDLKWDGVSHLVAAAVNEGVSRFTQPILSYPIVSYPILFYPILSYPILSYPILSYPILFYPILSYPILSYPVLSYPILSYPILSNSILSYSILSYPILSYPILSYPIQFYPIQFYPILSYPILSYPILSYPILSYPIQSYPILSYPILSYPILTTKYRTIYC